MMTSGSYPRRASLSQPHDAPPRHCRMAAAGVPKSLPGGNGNDDNDSPRAGSSTVSAKHFSQRRRHHLAGSDGNSSIGSSVSGSWGVPLVEQVILCGADRSPTKPERTYSVMGSPPRIPARRYCAAKSTKEEEKARQFLKEVEDRKALKALKAHTLRLADLPAPSRTISSVAPSSLPPLPPLDEREDEGTPRASPPRKPSRSDEEDGCVPTSIHLPLTTLAESSTMYSELSFNDDVAAAAGVSPRFTAPPISSAAAAASLAPPHEAAPAAACRVRECPASIQRQLMSLPASRYSTRRLPNHDHLSMPPPPASAADHRLRQRSSHGSAVPPRRHPSIRGPHNTSHLQQQPLSAPSSPSVDPHHHCHHSHSCQGHHTNNEDARSSPVRPSPPPPPTSSSSSSSRPRMLIQVAPGMQATLRSSDETWEAIKNDFYMPGLCLGCGSTLFVVQDAAYILCPGCHTVSPMDGLFVDTVNAGVGLGFKYDDLVRWQSEILQEQQYRQRR